MSDDHWNNWNQHLDNVSNEAKLNEYTEDRLRERIAALEAALREIASGRHRVTCPDIDPYDDLEEVARAALVPEEG